MNVLTVVGNRPQFIKAAAVSGPLRQAHSEVLIHTGQHFDEELSGVFFTELGLPSPDRELGIARGSNTSQVARMLAALEPVIAEVAPDVVLVYGDTNSTVAGALAGARARSMIPRGWGNSSSCSSPCPIRCSCHCTRAPTGVYAPLDYSSASSEATTSRSRRRSATSR